MQYLAVHVDQCRARLDLVGWATSDGVVHVLSCGYRGSFPPQLVPERLVPIVQRRLVLVRAGANKAEQSNSWSDHHDELPSSSEQLRAARTTVRQ